MENDNYSEEMPILPQESTLIIDANIRVFLAETIKWGRFLAVVGFIMTGLIAVIGVVMMFVGSAITSQLPAGFGMGGFLGFIYLLMGLLYYFPSKYLYDFCAHTKQALLINNQESLSYAFSKLKSFYKFWGILLIIFLVFYVLALFWAFIMAGLFFNFN